MSMTRILTAVMIVMAITMTCISSVSAALTHHWKMDEASDTVASDSVGTKDGVLQGLPLPAWTTGYIDGAVDLERSVSNYVSIVGHAGSGPGLIPAASDFTIMAWIKDEQFSIIHTIFSQFRTTDGRFSFHMNGNFLEIYQKGATPEVVKGSTPFSTSQWYHVAFVRDGANGVAYVNGVEEFSTTGMINLDDTSVFTSIGARYGYSPGDFFDGLIDDVQLYNEALSEADIRELISYPVADYHWKLDETSGTVASDSMGGKDGTLSGSPTWLPSGGKFDGALDFEKDNSDVVILGVGNGIIPAASDFTVMAWIKGEDFSGATTARTIFSQYRTSTYTGRFTFRMVGDKLGIYQQGGPDTLTGTTSLSAGRWYHVAFVRDGINGVAYVNGFEEFSTTSMINILAASCYTRIGSIFYASAADFFDGLMDDVRIFKRALSPEEIAAFYIPPPSGTLIIIK